MRFHQALCFLNNKGRVQDKRGRGLGWNRVKLEAVSSAVGEKELVSFVVWSSEYCGRNGKRDSRQCQEEWLLISNQMSVERVLCIVADMETWCVCYGWIGCPGLVCIRGHIEHVRDG